MELPTITVGHKIWFNIHINGEEVPFIGERKIILLREIMDTGSINEAAKNLGLDYHKAWDMIESVHEKIAPLQLVTTKRGRHGGTELSPFAMLILDKYERFNYIVEKELENEEL